MDTSLGATKPSVQVSTDRTAAAMSSVPGITAASSGGLNGTGAETAPTRATGASNSPNNSECSWAANSVPKPPKRHDSCATTARRVRVTDRTTMSKSSGTRDRRSIPSTSMPSDDGHTLGGCGL